MEKESLDCALMEVDDTNKRREEKLDQYENLSHDEQEEYSLAIDELQQLIMYQRTIISMYLQNKELPDPDDRPKFSPVRQRRSNDEEPSNNSNSKENKSNDRQATPNDAKSKQKNEKEEVKIAESTEEIVADADSVDGNLCFEENVLGFV